FQYSGLQKSDYTEEKSLYLAQSQLRRLTDAKGTLSNNEMNEPNGAIAQRLHSINEGRLSVIESVHDETEHRIMEKSFPSVTRRNLMEQTYNMARSQSYVLMLFVMMAWSLLYHSWLTFVLMIVSCVVWMYPNSQRFCLKISPYIAVYAQALVLIQFVYGLDLTQAELPDEKPVFLRQIGLEKSRLSPPWRPILLKFTFTVLFWVTVKQRTKERRRDVNEEIELPEKAETDAESPLKDEQPPLQSSLTAISPAVSYLRHIVTKYWVIVNLCLLLAISLQNPVVFYRIIYMAFFQIFVNCFQISFPTWRKSLYAFWTLMVAYCMFVLSLIYTYQFHGFPQLYQQYLGMSEDVLRSFGLERFSSGQLFIRLLTPISFLIFTLVQMNFFHENLMERTGKWEKAFYYNQSRLPTMLGKFQKRHGGLLNIVKVASSEKNEEILDDKIDLSPKANVKIRIEEPEEESNFPRVKEYIDIIGERCRSFADYHELIVNYSWRFTEIHIDKAIAFMMLHICVSEISAMNIVYIIYIAVTLRKPTHTKRLGFSTGIWTSLIIILKMVYQMEFIKEENLSVFCEDVFGINATVRAPEWIGLHKTDKVFTYTRDYILLTILFAFRAIVELRQSLYRYEHGDLTPIRGVLFSNITRKDADIDMLNCLKYFANFFFYRFGLEVCRVTAVITIGLRSDLISVIYAAFLLATLSLKRKTIAQIWPYSTTCLAVLFAFQYTLCVGIPKAFCHVYPWTNWDHNMIEWLFLPDFMIPPNPVKLYADFFLLLFMSLQLRVFRIEASERDYVGGSNKSVLDEGRGRRTLLKVNSDEKVEKLNSAAVPDFIGKSDTLLDHAKRIVFVHLWWLTLSMVFIAGTSRVTLFAFGYVVGCFLFLWVGNSLFLRPVRVALALLNKLILYNACVIFIKISLQVVGCVYMSQMYKNYCWVLQLFGIACLKTGVRPEKIVDPAILAECSVPHREAGIFYDGMCFMFLLIQQRIFGSEYFKHVVAEIRAQKFIASRGAEIIAKITKKQVEEAERKEDEILSKVKKKMDRIRMKHERGAELQRPSTLIFQTQKQEEGDVLPEASDTREHSAHIIEPSEESSRPTFFTPSDSISVQFPNEDLRANATKKRTKSISSDSKTVKRMDSISPSLKQRIRFASRAVAGAQETVDFESGDEWSSDEEDKLGPDLLEEVGVKGLGPLQLLNYAFKKGAIKEALKESNEIEAAHARMEREMEDAFGVADHNAIRRAILRQKARRPKADYDESTFDEESITRREELPSLLRSTLGAAAVQSRGKKRSDSSALSRMPSTHDDSIREASEERSQHAGETQEQAPPTNVGQRRSSVHPLLEAPAVAKSPSSVAGAIQALAVLEMCVVEKQNRDAAEEEQMRLLGTHRSRLQQLKLRFTELARNLGTFALLFGRGVIESTIENLMSLSRDYRYIARVLTTEKEQHKEMLIRIEDESDLRSALLNHRKSLVNHRCAENSKMVSIDESFVQLHRYVQSTEDSAGRSTPASKAETASIVTTKPAVKKERDHMLVRLIQALYYVLLSRSEIICYFMIVLNQMHSASILSMPLPLMTLLWGTLTVPRPSKNFWITMITYTQAMVIVKYIFQFGFFPWNKITASVHPFWPPRIIGIEKKDKYAAWDLALLMALFFHRNILKSIGLWDEKASATIQEDAAKSRRRSSNCRATPTRLLSPTETAVPVEADHDETSRSSRSSSSSSDGALKRKLSMMKSAAEQLINKRKVINKTNARLNVIRRFFSVLLNPVDRFPLDLYAPMFLCDVICFLIIIFGYSGFGADAGSVDGGVTAYFEENKVPGTLVSMLILQFVLIILDRAIFLRKFLFAKIVFQVVLVIFIHVWMFFLLPAATDRMFVTIFPCKLFYLTKIIYFLISAKQIQAGYPKRSLGNIITNSYTMINWILYKAFMLIPFLFELRALMDWMWMDTSLGVGDWFMLNDIYSHVSMIKCERNIEEDYPSPKGVKKRPILKYGLGGVLLTAIILIIWFPLVIFSMANTVGTRSLPVECTCKLTIAGFEPLFKSTAQLSDIRELTYEEYDNFQYTYRTSKQAQAYMADYTHRDVVQANINGDSSSRWSISPPSRTALVRELRGEQRMSLKFEWYFKRAPDENLQFGTAEDFRVINLEPGDPIRLDLADVIASGSRKLIRVPHLLIPIVKVPGEGKSDHVHALLSVHLKNDDDSIESTFYDGILQLDSMDGIEWWKLRMVDPSFDPMIPKEEVVLDNIVIYGFVDKVFPVTFSIITGGGILSLYLSMVLVFGRLMRSVVTGAMQRIMFEELPNVDRILRLCLDIYLVREAGELQLEEDLFAKLVFLFRSPATLIKWTREKTA
uniref:Piezo-type mechanosensitive ion channel component n=1 Tax=Parascaris univalens TaxID=6257 RepID=A0A915B433_PARUN